jgi:RNA polymerase sigma factor (sigma-70 family)
MSAAILRHLRRRFADASPDGELLRRYLDQRDHDAFRGLVERHGPAVLGECRRRLRDPHAADDAFQAVFLVLARNAKSVRRPEALAAWLYGIARRVCAKARAARARRAGVESQVTLCGPAADPAETLSARELLEVLDAELDRLPERYRVPLWLVYWQGVSHADAARQLGLSAGALHGRLERGRRRLADRLRGRGFAPDGAERVVLMAGSGAVAVPANLLTHTVAFAAAPWSKTLPATIMALAAVVSPSKLVPAVTLALLLTGAGAIGLLTSRERERPEVEAPQPPVAHAPGSPEQPRVDRYGDPLPPGALLRLGTTRYRSDDTITHLSARPDGRHVAFCNRDAVVVMDLQTGLTLHRFPRGPRTVNGQERGSTTLSAVAFAPDGRTYAAGCDDYGPEPPSPLPIWLYDAATGERRREFSGHDKKVTALAFVAAGRQIASLGGDGVIRIWDAATGAKLRELTRPQCKLESLAATPDGRIVATGAEARDGKAPVYVWNVSSSQLVHTLDGHTGTVKALAFSADGRTLATTGEAVVRLWDVASGRALRQFDAPAAHIPSGVTPLIHSIAFSPDGRLLAAARTDTSIRVWSLSDGKLVDQSERYCSFPVGLAFLDDRNLILGSGRTVFLRDVVSRSFKIRAEGSEYGIARVGISPDGRTVITADPSSSVHTWDAQGDRHLLGKVWSRWTVTTMVSPDARLVAFTEGEGAETVTCLGDVATGRIVRRLTAKEHHPAAFLNDYRTLVTFLVREPKSPEEPPLRVWDIGSGTELGQFKVGRVSFALDISPDRRSLFMSEVEHTVKQCDMATGRTIREFKSTDGKAIRASALAASQGGRRLAINGDDSKVRLCDVVTGQECWSAETGFGAEAVAFSPYGTLVAVGHCGPLVAPGQIGSDGQIDLLDARTGRRLARLRGHDPRHGVTSLVFSRDGRRLVSASFDCTALVWDVEAVIGRPLRPLDDASAAQLWDDLGGDAASVAHTIDCWQAAPDAAVNFLRGKLKPIVAVPPERVAGLLADLDSASFSTREVASKALERLGPGATGPVRAALANVPSAEVKRRAQAALDAWECEGIRAAHGVEVLEYIATPPSRALLADLAGGAPDAPLTRQAKASLDRLPAPAR